MPALDPLPLVLSDPGQAFSNGQRVELCQSQAKRSGDSEVSTELLGSR